MMDQTPKSRRSWLGFTWKVFSMLKLLRHLALIWHHPFATSSLLVFVRLFFYTPLMQPLLRFFFPLFALIFLCIIAFICFGSLMEQKESQVTEEVGEEIAGLDVLGLGGGWAAYHCFQSHIISKQEDIDLHSVAKKMKNTNEFLDVGDGSDSSPRVERMKMQNNEYLDVGNGSESSPRVEEKMKNFNDFSDVVNGSDGSPKVEKIKSINEFLDVANGSDSSPQEGNSLITLENAVEEHKLLHVQLEDGLENLQKEQEDRRSVSNTLQVADGSKLMQEAPDSNSLSVPKKGVRRRIRFRFVDEVDKLHGLAGGKYQVGSELCDLFMSDTDPSEDDDDSVLSEESDEIKNYADGGCSLTEDTKDKLNYASDIEDTNADWDEQGHDTGSESETHGGCSLTEEIKENLNYVSDIVDTTADWDDQGCDTGSDSETHELEGLEDKHYDLISGEPITELKLEIKEIAGTNFPSAREVEIDEEFGLDVLFNFHQELPDSDSEKNNDLEENMKNENQMDDNTNPLNELNCDLTISNESVYELPSDNGGCGPKSEAEQEVESVVLMNDDANVMDVSDLGRNSDAKEDREVHYVGVTEQEWDSRQEIDSQTKMEDKTDESSGLPREEISAVLLDHKLQHDNTSNQLDDPKKDPPKWREWIWSFEIDGKSMWTSEKETCKNVDRNSGYRDLGQEITGTVNLDIESATNGAFIFVDQDEHGPLEELDAFIQNLTVKLQDFEAKSSQKNLMDELATSKSMNNMPTENPLNEEAAPTCTVREDAARSNCVDLSPRAATPDDSFTEEGDGSSRWDEAVDTSEKESADSEMEEGRVWPAPETDDLGLIAIEKEFGILRFDSHELEKEYRSLKDPIRHRGPLKIRKYDKISEEELDPYVNLFAQTFFIDAVAEVPTSLFLHPDHQALKFSQKSAKAEAKSKANEVKDRSILNSKGLFRKPRLGSISKAIKAIKGVKN